MSEFYRVISSARATKKMLPNHMVDISAIKNTKKTRLTAANMKRRVFTEFFFLFYRVLFQTETTGRMAEKENKNTKFLRFLEK